MVLATIIKKDRSSRVLFAAIMSIRNDSQQQPLSFFDRLKKDIDNDQFNDITLQGPHHEIVPCSRLALSMSSTMFADLLEYPDETTFSSPFSGWVLREIRHVCYFGTLQELKFDDDDTAETVIRKLCQLLVAMDYYLVFKLNVIPSLTCVVMDEFDIDTNGETRPWISKSIDEVASLLKNDQYKVLLSENDDDIGGVCCIQDSNKIHLILSKLKAFSKATVWFEFETLYRWACANESNQEAASELWEETDMLQRLINDEPDCFAERDTKTFDANNFASSHDFEDLYQYAREKNRSSSIFQESECVEKDTYEHSSTQEPSECFIGSMLWTMFVGWIVWTIHFIVYGERMGSIYLTHPYVSTPLYMAFLIVISCFVGGITACVNLCCSYCSNP